MAGLSTIATAASSTQAWVLGITRAPPGCPSPARDPGTAAETNVISQQSLDVVAGLGNHVVCSNCPGSLIQDGSPPTAKRQEAEAASRQAKSCRDVRAEEVSPHGSLVGSTEIKVAPLRTNLGARACNFLGFFEGACANGSRSPRGLARSRAPGSEPMHVSSEPPGRHATLAALVEPRRPGAAFWAFSADKSNDAAKEQRADWVWDGKGR
ncbi:hypothetical protein VTI74DRAFT_238 [Chaetomium olivicolor]